MEPTPRTIGLSNKLVKTLIGAVGAQAVAFVVSLIASGEFSRTEFSQLVSLALTALVGLAAGYQAQPDVVAPVAE